MESRPIKTPHPLSELPKTSCREMFPNFRFFLVGLKKYAIFSFLLSIIIALMASLFPLGSKIIIDFILEKNSHLVWPPNFQSLVFGTSQLSLSHNEWLHNFILHIRKLIRLKQHYSKILPFPFKTAVNS